MPSADPTENEQGNGRSDPSELAMPTAVALREEVRNLQACRYGPGGLRAEGSAQGLSLFGILRPPLPLLRMRGKIGVDHLGAFGCEATVDPSLQVVLFNGPPRCPHFTLLSAALRRGLSSLMPPCI